MVITSIRLYFPLITKLPGRPAEHVGSATFSVSTQPVRRPCAPIQSNTLAFGLKFSRVYRPSLDVWPPALADNSPSERAWRPPSTLRRHGAWCHTRGSLGSEFIVLGLLVFELELLGRDLAVCVAVLVGEHILHNHLSIKAGSELPFAGCHLGMNVLRELERGGTGSDPNRTGFASELAEQEILRATQPGFSPPDVG